MKHSLKLILIINLFFIVSCTSLFYQPSKKKIFDVYDSEIIRENRYIETKDGVKLHGWYFPAQKDGQKVKPKALVLMFHGNAQNISSHFLSLFWLVEEQYDYLLYDYRGYGQSEGEVKNDTVLRDVEAMLKEARALAKKRSVPLVLYGQSLGGTLLLKYLSNNPDFEYDDLIIEGSFYSFQEIAKLKAKKVWLLWPFQWLVPLLISDQNSLDKTELQSLSGEKLVIHSKDDFVVPFSQGEKVYEALPKPKAIWQVPYKTHTGNTRVNDGEYRVKLLKRWQEKL